MILLLTIVSAPTGWCAQVYHLRNTIVVEGRQKNSYSIA